MLLTRTTLGESIVAGTLSGCGAAAWADDGTVVEAESAVRLEHAPSANTIRKASIRRIVGLRR